MKPSLIPFGAAAAALLAVVVALPSDGLFSADSGPKYWQTWAFAEGDGIPRTFEYPAHALDPRFLHVPAFTVGVNGRLASIYPVLFPLLSAGPVALFGDRALRLVPWLAALAAAWAAGLMASSLRGRDVTGGVAAMVLAATPLAFYSVTFWEHSLAALLVVAGILSVVGRRPENAIRWWRWALFGLLIGTGAWVRTEVGFLAPVVLMAMLIGPQGRRLGLALAGVAGVVAGVAIGGVVQFLCLGRWLPLHVTYHVAPTFHSQPFFSSRIESVLRFLSPHWSCGLAVLVWVLALAVVLTGRASRSRVGLTLATAAVGCSVFAGVAIPLGRWLQGARPTVAFPEAAPAATWMILSAMPVVLWGHDRRVHPQRRMVVPVVAAVWLPVSVFLVWSVRSFEWGGRLFLPSVVTLVAVMGSFPLAAGPMKRFRRLTVGLAIAMALVIQGLGLVLVHHGTTTHRGIAAEIEAFIDPAEPVITDAYMVPLVAGRGWFEARYLFCTKQPNLSQLVTRIGRGGGTRWTYATVEAAPGARLEIHDRLLDNAGRLWILTDRLERKVRTQTLRLQRYRRAGSRQ